MCCTGHGVKVMPESAPRRRESSRKVPAPPAPAEGGGTMTGKLAGRGRPQLTMKPPPPVPPPMPPSVPPGTSISEPHPYPASPPQAPSAPVVSMPGGLHPHPHPLGFQACQESSIIWGVVWHHQPHRPHPHLPCRCKIYLLQVMDIDNITWWHGYMSLFFELWKWVLSGENNDWVQWVSKMIVFLPRVISYDWRNDLKIAKVAYVGTLHRCVAWKAKRHLISWVYRRPTRVVNRRWQWQCRAGLVGKWPLEWPRGTGSVTFRWHIIVESIIWGKFFFGGAFPSSKGRDIRHKRSSTIGLLRRGSVLPSD